MLMEVYASLSAPVAPMEVACVKEKGCFLLMSATNTPRVHFVTGPVMLTAVLQFVMRWIPDLSVVRTPIVRMSAPMTTALMLTAPQASTVSTLTLVKAAFNSVGFRDTAPLVPI